MKNKVRKVYLDNSATTPVDQGVIAAMMPFLTEKFGNASSLHSFGQEARDAIDRARQEVAVLIGAHSNEIVFTSGGTESNNLAIRGLLDASEIYGRHIITSAIEHSAVKEVCGAMEKRGFAVTRLPVYENGIVRIEDVKAAIRPETILISVMTANNEVGTIQPVAEIGAIVKAWREKGSHIWFHTDAVQAVGKIPIDVKEIGCDLLSVSAHKLYAPKGIGALYARRGVKIETQNAGGHQEREIRAGTESVAGIVAFGEAARLARGKLSANYRYLKNLRDRFETLVKSTVPSVQFNGDRKHRLPHISNLSFSGVKGEGLLIQLDLQGVAVSTGAACSAGNFEPSPVLRALGINVEMARGAIRVSFGKDNSEDDVDYAVECIASAVARIRAN